MPRRSWEPIHRYNAAAPVVVEMAAGARRRSTLRYAGSFMDSGVSKACRPFGEKDQAHVPSDPCSDCGRAIQPHEVAVIHGGEAILCPHCDLVRRLGCPEMTFCTRCFNLISRNQVPSIIDGLIVCEPCTAQAEASPPTPTASGEPPESPEPPVAPESPQAMKSEAEAKVESEEDAAAARAAALSLSSAWLRHTEAEQPRVGPRSPVTHARA